MLIVGPDARVDAADFYHATIWSNSTYDGLGSWGDPKNDYQISTGGFKDIKVAYPVPHHIRRNFTLQPFAAGDLFFPGPPIDPLLIINTTFTQAAVDAAVDSYTGDYVNFQIHVEGVPYPHPGPHFIMGGDMFGKCPFGMVPPACVSGPKWAPNGKGDFGVDFVRVLNET